MRLRNGGKGEAIAVNYTKITTHNNQILYESYKKHFQDKVLDIY
jgi:hypothetical protein